MPFELLQAGVDKIDRVPVESIEVVEAGPGGVSSMSFTVDDPGQTESFAKYDLIQLKDASSNVLFRGYVTSVTSRPVAIGREFDVEATGVEVLLDWLIGLPIVITAGRTFALGTQDIITGKTAIFNTTLNTTGKRAGDAAEPIGDWDHPTYGTPPVTTGGVFGPAVNVARNTLRQQVEYLAQHSGYDNAGTYVSFNHMTTVDFNMGLRSWEDDIANLQPDDYTTLTVVDTPAGTYRVHVLQHTRDWGSVIDRVRVVGSSEAWVGSTASIRHEAVLEDSTLTTADLRTMAGEQFLISNGAETRGTLRLEDWTPVATVHAGGRLLLTDANVSVSAQPYRIMEIRKKFYSSGRQDWEISYGRLAPSAIRAVGAVVVRR